MKILHLTWEYPPHKIGGLATHVEELAKAQARMGLEPIVVTCAFSDNYGFEEKDGIKVYRFDANHIPAEDFPSWTLQMNTLLTNKATEALNEHEDVVLIHAHDWLVSTAAVTLKHMYRKPLIVTLHSMEIGRRGGIYDDRQKLIHDLEGRIVFESWKTICCSHYMKNATCSAFSTPWDKVDVIENGVDVNSLMTNLDLNEVKSRYALPDEKVIFFVGRHVWEKGLDVLIGSMPQVLEKYPDAKLVIAGKGYMTDKCKQIANDVGVAHKVVFTGFIENDVMNALYRLSDVVVVPSRYEPFGIVALEAMACETPVIVADTGGLSEIIEHDKDGLKVWANNSESLSWGINRILGDVNFSNVLSKNAKEKINNIYSWDIISKKTKALYDNVVSQHEKSDWKAKRFVMEEN